MNGLAVNGGAVNGGAVNGLAVNGGGVWAAVGFIGIGMDGGTDGR